MDDIVLFGGVAVTGVAMLIAAVVLMVLRSRDPEGLTLGAWLSAIGAVVILAGAAIGIATSPESPSDGTGDAAGGVVATITERPASTSPSTADEDTANEDTDDRDAADKDRADNKDATPSEQPASE